MMIMMALMYRIAGAAPESGIPYGVAFVCDLALVTYIITTVVR